MRRYVINTKRLVIGAILSGLCFLLAFESIHAISIKDGCLIFEQRHLWSLVKSQKSIPVPEITSVDVRRGAPCRGGAMSRVFICCRNGERLCFGGGRSLGNKAFEIKELLNDSIENGRNLDEIISLEYMIMFGVAVLVFIFTLLVSIAKQELNDR